MTFPRVKRALRGSLIRLALIREAVALREDARISYSQEGEDLLLRRMLEQTVSGIYVDLGAHHPHRFSNSYWAYRKGWKGVVVDAAPDFASAFAKMRPRDLIIECALGSRPGEATYFTYAEPALNTMSFSRRDHLEVEYGIRPINELSVPVRTLAEILHENLPTSAAIDFMSIDLEGYELETLRGGDWSTFRPRIVVCESIGFWVDECEMDPIAQFMNSIGYSLYAKLHYSFFYVADEAKSSIGK